jgi:hypothetical protein
MLRGGTEIFSGIKGGALKVLDILKGEALNFSTFWSSRGVHSHHNLETTPYCEIQAKIM